VGLNAARVSEVRPSARISASPASASDLLVASATATASLIVKGLVCTCPLNWFSVGEVCAGFSGLGLGAAAGGTGACCPVGGGACGRVVTPVGNVGVCAGD